MLELFLKVKFVVQLKHWCIDFLNICLSSTCHEFWAFLEKIAFCLDKDLKWKALNRLNATEYSVVCCVSFYEFMAFEFYNRALKNSLPVQRTIKIINVFSYSEDTNRKPLLEEKYNTQAIKISKKSDYAKKVKQNRKHFDISHWSNFTAFIFLFLLFSVLQGNNCN